MNENEIFCIDGLNMRIQKKRKVQFLLKWLKLILYPQNMPIDTKIILIPCIVTEIFTKEGFSVMVALIWILGRLPKDDRVASFRFLKSTPRRNGRSKDFLRGGGSREFSQHSFQGGRMWWNLLFTPWNWKSNLFCWQFQNLRGALPHYLPPSDADNQRYENSKEDFIRTYYKVLQKSRVWQPNY